MYRAQGFAHAIAVHHVHRLRSSQDGQGTVEYIGLILLLAAVMSVVAAKGGAGKSIGDTVVKSISNTIAEVGK
jgi:H+/gluconate symporter-like permease